MIPATHPLTRREMLALLGALGAQAALAGTSGCAGSSSSSAAAAPNPQPVPAGLVVSSSVTVSTAVAAALPQGFAGLSYEKSAIARRTLTTTSSGIVKLFQLLNAQGALRVGANSADSTTYIPNGPGQVLGQVTNADIDLFAAFAKAVNCSVIYGINMKGAFATPSTQTPALAAAEATYVAKALGSSLQAFEIGNEPDLYASYSYAQYVTLWESMASAINAAVPGIPLSGPAIASTPNISSWTTPFSLAEKSRNLTLLTQHRYVASTGTDATLLSDINTSQTPMEALKVLAASRGMAWRMSETGSFYSTTYSSGSGSVAQDFATALWVIDYLFANALNGAQGVNMHNGNLIQNSAYVPFSDDEVNSVTFVNAVFYGMLLFTMGGSGSVVQTTITTYVNVSAYTVMVDAKHYSTWIINKDATASQNLSVTLNLPSAVQSATLKVLQGTSLGARSGTTIQGSGVGVDGSFHPAPDYTPAVSGKTITCYVPYNSAVLVQSVLS